MSNSKQRIEWIELAQILSMILIVFHHSMPNFTAVHPILAGLGGTLHYPALALFFFASGWLATGWAERGYPGYIGRRAVRLLVPWIVISLLMLLPKALLASPQARADLLSVGRLGWALLDPHGQGIMPHLWYLPALFLLCLLVPLLERAARHKPAVVILLVAAFACACLPESWVKVTTVLCLNEIRMYLFWFLLGYFGRKRLGEIRFGKSLLIPAAVLSWTAALLLVFFAGAFPFARVLITAFGFVGILSLALLAAGGLRPLILFFRGKTMCVYLWSLCAQNLVEVLAGKVHLNGELACLIMFVTGLAVPLAICALFSLIEKLSGRRWKALRVALGI